MRATSLVKLLVVVFSPPHLSSPGQNLGRQRCSIHNMTLSCSIKTEVIKGVAPTTLQVHACKLVLSSSSSHLMDVALYMRSHFHSRRPRAFSLSSWGILPLPPIPLQLLPYCLI